LGLGASVGFGEDVARSRSLVCLRTASTPTMDGQLAEDVWKNAPAASGFISMGTRDVPEVKPDWPVEDRTMVRALYDDERLYFGVECAAPEKPKFRVLQAGRDVNFLSAEAVEVFISPRPEAGVGYQLAVNPEGGQLDAQVRNASFDLGWNGEWKSAVCGGPGKWTAELAVPFKALGVDAPKGGTIWAVNFLRDHSSWHAMSVWSNPVAPHLADLRTYGHLLFVDPRDEVSLISLSCPLRALWGTNVVGYAWRDRSGAERTGELAVSVTRAGQIPCQATAQGRAFHFSLWVRDLLSLRLEKSLVAKEDKMVAAKLTVFAAPDFLRGLTLKAKLVDRAGKSVEKELSAPSPEIQISLPVAELSAGVCRFQVEAWTGGTLWGREERRFDLLAGELPF